MISPASRRRCTTSAIPPRARPRWRSGHASSWKSAAWTRRSTTRAAWTTARGRRCSTPGHGHGPRHHLLLGQALAPLAREGVLIIGSGHLTHNLRELRSVRDTGVGPAASYVSAFQSWVRECIESRDLDRLAGYRRLSGAGARAHPTEEHFLPLFVALGAAAPGYRAERLIEHVEGGVMAMDAYLFQPPA